MAVSNYFVWGKGGAKLTPEEIERQRAIEDRLASGGIDTSPVAHPLQGLARVAQAMAGSFRRGQLDKAAADIDAYNTDTYGGLSNSIFGDAAPSAIPASDVSREVTATQPTSSQPVTNDIMGDFMAPIREEVKNPYALAAIASTGRAESGYDPQKMNARWSDPSQSGQQGTSGGLMSWRNDRLANLENYAKLAGEDPSNISAGTQGRFFLQEDPNLIAQLNNAQSVEEAQDLMNNAWRFAGYDGPSQERSRRLGYAQEYLPTFQTTETASLDPSVGMPVADAANTEWLQYANSGATRNQPISGDLQKALSFLPEMGLSLEVFSGGQPGIDEGGERVGSTRHDHGGALDGFLHDTATGRRLDWNDPKDQPIFAEVVKRARANGVTGFGAGDGYMQPGSMHIGYGNPGVWGSGGKGANAAQWLRAAYEAPLDQATVAQQAIASVMPEQETVLDPIQTTAAMNPDAGVQVADASGFVPGGTAQGEGMQRQRIAQMLQQRHLAQAEQPQTGLQVQQPVTAGQGTDQRAILAQAVRALSDPRANERTRLVAKTLIDREMKRQAALQEQQIWQQRQQMEWNREDSRNAVLDQRDADDRAYKRAQDEQTNQFNRDKFAFEKEKAAVTSDITEYNLAKREGYTGTFTEYQQMMKKAGAATTNIDTGTIPAGFRANRDENGRIVSIEPLPGSPAAAEAEKIARANSLRETNNQDRSGLVSQEIDRALDVMKTGWMPDTGWGDWLSSVPGTDAKKLSGLLTTIKANIGFGELNKMRAESPTGGALGNVTETELNYLQAVAGNLDQSQDAETLQDNLNRLWNAYQDVIHGEGNGPARRKLSFQQETTTEKSPEGVDQEVWDVMTPEEKKLWQN